MANRIAGITIEIGGDTTKLQTALKGVDKTLKTTQANLKDINKLLKLDPKNTDLLNQKQKNLQTAIKATKDRLAELKQAQSQFAKGSAEWDAIGREISATEQDLKKLEGEYRSFGSVAKQVVQAVGKQMQDLGKKITAAGQKFQPVSRAAAAVVTGMGALGMSAINTADDLETLSKQTGLSTDEIQKMQYASELVDVSLDSITGALKKMKPKMTDSNETFAKLGVSIRDADGNMRSATDVFYDSLTALSQIENETERDQVAMELFGKGADELAGIIDDGGQALKDYGKEAEDLGLIMGGDELEALSAINDQVVQLKNQFKGSALKLGAKIAEAAAPIVEKLAAGLEKVAAWFDKLTPQQAEMALKIAAVVAAIAPVMMIIGKLVTGIGGLISAFGFLLSPIGLIIAAIVALIAIGVLLYKNWDKIKAKAEEIKNNIVASWNNMKANVAATVDNIKTAVVEKWENIKTTVQQKIEDLKNGAVNKFNAMKDTIKNVIDRIKQLFNFQWKLPHLKLPHLSITYEEAGDLGKFFGVNRIPHLSVEWYKKAYDNAMMFTRPTVMATPYGYKGFGDGSGAEIVMGLDKLREVVGANQNVTVNVVLQGDARQMFRVISQQNNTRTRATGYNALAAMGV